MRYRRAGFVLVSAVLACSVSCGYHELSFQKDDRVKIVEPLDRAEARLPVTIRWTVKDFDVTGPAQSATRDAGYFGVYVDQAPQPPGQSFRWFARNDYQCKVTQGCPDETYYASKHVYATTKTTFVVRKLPEVRPEEARKYRDLHEVVIVLLDGLGRRIGESSFQIDFQLKR